MSAAEPFDPRALHERMSERLAKIRQVIDVAQAPAARDAERGEELAKAARTGRLGPDWQRVQQRIDLNQTTLAAVFDGTDDSPSAQRLRRASRAGLRTLPDHAVGHATDGDVADDVKDPLTVLDEMRQRIERRSADLHARLSGWEDQ